MKSSMGQPQTQLTMIVAKMIQFHACPAATLVDFVSNVHQI